MDQAYDLFKQNDNDKSAPIFVETVVGLHQMEKRLMKLSSIKPGTYLVYDPTEAKFVEPFKRST